MVRQVSRPLRPSAFEVLAVPLAFAALKLLLEALVIRHYGYFRDELYYIACSRHLAWGYVDQPPLSIALLAVQRALIGDSLTALRTLPALTGAATVLITGLIVREFGGGRLAQALACLGMIVAPVYLLIGHFFSMNVFDEFFWALGALLVLRALKDDRPRPGPWLAVGLTLGLGLLNKSSMLWFGGALALGLLLTPHRRALTSPWPWLAGAVALVINVPNILWQMANHWPTVEFMHNATQSKMVRTSFATFWMEQLLVMSPATLPVWGVGLVWLLRDRRRRLFGLMFLAVAALLIVSGSSRPNYLTVAYPPLLAGGGVAIARYASAGKRRAWIRPAALTLVLLVALPFLPVGWPILSPDRLAGYLGASGLKLRPQEHSREAALPQYYADMFGWEDLTRRVARVYRSLPADEQAKCAIGCDNYGEAGAIDFFGPRYGLPPAISGHNNYWFWGTHGATGEVMILVGGSRRDRHSDFRSVELADTTACTYCMPYENGAPIFVCRGLDRPLSVRWPEVKSYR